MARIRSIKPEYWRSESITRLSRSARLTFIALWSYVDDNGVGLANEKLIVAEIMPLEDDAADARRIVREDLAELARESRVTLYTVSGRSYLSIEGWDEHQKIDRPNKGRYPRPDAEEAAVKPLTCENMDPRATPAQSSRSPRAVPSPGAVELGSSGTGEQGNRGVPPSAADAVAPRTDPPDGDSAQTLVGEWIDHCQDRPPGRVIGQVAKELATMLAEDIPTGDVRAGLRAWHDKRLHPSSLASVVHEVRQGPRRPASTTDDRVAQGLALAQKYAQEGR